MISQQIYSRASAPVGATGNSGDLPCSLCEFIAIDANIGAPGGTSPSITLSWQRKGLDGVYYPVYAFAAKTAAAAVSQSIGRGMETAKDCGQTGRLVWTVSGTGVSTTVASRLVNTTVTTGVASATQTVGDTTGMAQGDTLFFATANVTRTIASVTDATTVVLTASVTSTTGETVTSATSKQQVMTSTAGMVTGDTLHFATANVDRVIASVIDATNVVLTVGVASTDTEVVTSAAPYIPFSASITGK